ncbi:hypothetical protein M434DRAFT_377149 [Hypoxylon sp. CO27-5]|nr:hypothetical protein M434DRAFT_377149 [Hypoxylon sp. CO27-5]
MSGFDITPEKRATQRAFMKRQLFSSIPVVTRKEVDFEGKTAIITGSNIGLGFERARQFLDLGLSRLILAVRNESKGQNAKKELLMGRSPNAQAIERAKGLQRLDILINNAAVSKLAYEASKHTGHEETVRVNYLSVALLTILFLPILKDKNSPERPGRLVIVNSEVASWAKFNERNSVPLLPALDEKSSFKLQERYYTSKLMGQFFVSELAKRVPASVAVVNAPSPGLCKSNLYREFGGTFAGFLFGIFQNIFARTVSVGARTLTDAAVKHGKESHGQYIEDCKIQPMAPIVYKPEGLRIAEQLWKETLEELAFVKAADIIESLGSE